MRAREESKRERRKTCHCAFIAPCNGQHYILIGGFIANFSGHSGLSSPRARMEEECFFVRVSGEIRADETCNLFAKKVLLILADYGCFSLSGTRLIKIFYKISNFIVVNCFLSNSSTRNHFMVLNRRINQ